MLSQHLLLLTLDATLTTIVDLEHSANQDFTDQFVLVQRDTGEILLCLAQEVGRKFDNKDLGYDFEIFQENVSMTANVLVTEPVLTSTAGLPVRLLVERMPSVKQGTMVLSAPVPQVLLETPLILADSPEDPRQNL